MNSKKFISLLSAAALAATSMVSLTALPAFASDGDVVIFSDTFNSRENTAAHTTASETIGQVLLDGSSISGNVSKDIPGITLTTTARNGGDDSSYFKIESKEDDAADKYLVTTTSRFARQGAGAAISFDNAPTPEDGKDVVLSFDMNMTDATGTEGSYDHALLIGGIIFKLTAFDLDDGNWHSYKVVVSTSGTKIYIDGETDPITSDSTKTLGELKFNSYKDGALVQDGVKSGTHPLGYPTWGIDNMVLYTSPDGASSTPPAAEDSDTTPEPEATAMPSAEITETTTVDFDKTFPEDVGITVTTHKDYTSEGVTTLSGSGNETGVDQIIQSSGKDNSYGYITYDISELTLNKSHIIVDYDMYIENSGRIKTVLYDGISSSTATSASSIISQGITSSSSTPNIVTDEWFHTSVDVNLEDGKGTYTVTKTSDGSTIGSGSVSTDLDAITTLSFVSWSPNTSYIDNLVIQTGGSIETEYATPEPAGTIDASNLFLDEIAGGTVMDSGFTALGDYEAQLNHSGAAKAVTGDMTAANDKSKGKSIYAAYDIYLAPDSSYSIKATGDSGNAISSQITMTVNRDHTVTISAATDKGTTTASETLVAETWYRVLLEIPQTSDGTTDALTFTVYRIDPDNSAGVTEVAAQLTGLSSRGLSGRRATGVSVTAEGDVYLDNAALFYAASGYSFYSEPASEVTPEPAGTVEGSYLNLDPEDASSTAAMDAAEGTSTTVLNHSDAKAAVATTDISAYFDKVRGKSVYVTYDVYVEKDSSFTLIPHGDSGKAQASTLQFSADSYGAVTVSAITASSSSSTADETLAAGTWYRVLVEIPQTGDSSATATGSITYTVYRIDSTDPTKTAGVAAQLTGLSARGLSDRALTSFETQTTGTAYIDNGVIYVYASTEEEEETWTQYDAAYADGRLTSVKMTEITDPASVDVSANSDTAKTFIWNQNYEPYSAG